MQHYSHDAVGASALQSERGHVVRHRQRVDLYRQSPRWWRRSHRRRPRRSCRSLRCGIRRRARYAPGTHQNHHQRTQQSSLNHAYHCRRQALDVTARCELFDLEIPHRAELERDRWLRIRTRWCNDARRELQIVLFDASAGLARSHPEHDEDQPHVVLRSSAGNGSVATAENRSGKCFSVSRGSLA